MRPADRLEGHGIRVSTTNTFAPWLHLGRRRRVSCSAYFGNDQAAIDASFTGTIVAPNAEVVLGTLRNAVFMGASFAKRVVVGPGTLVEFAEP